MHQVIENNCDYCGNETDEFRFCVNCGVPLCWEHVGRLSIAVHNDEGMRETAVYVCPTCLLQEPIVIHDLLVKKQKHNPRIETIGKILSILEG